MLTSGSHLIGQLQRTDFQTLQLCCKWQGKSARIDPQNLVGWYALIHPPWCNFLISLTLGLTQEELILWVIDAQRNRNRTVLDANLIALQDVSVAWVDIRHIMTYIHPASTQECPKCRTYPPVKPHKNESTQDNASEKLSIVGCFGQEGLTVTFVDV